jgi:Putative Ig domain
MAAVLLLTAVAAWAGEQAAAATPQRLDLRVLVLDDGSSWVEAVRSQLQVEGVPYVTVALGDSSRPTIDAAFLSSGDRGFYQGVVAPSYQLGSLSASEVTALRSYEATFAVREIDGFNWANPDVGLNYADFSGDIAGTTATVTPEGKEQGFQYLNGPVPFGQGSYSYVARPLTSTSSPPMPAGASFTPLVTAPAPNTGATGSIIGVYSHDGVEQLIITAAFNFNLPQFKTVAHGMITWLTRGVHFGYNRNRMTFHVDDAFSEVALWDPEHNCTPGEDCPLGPDGESLYPPSSIRMTPDDVQYAVQWQQANNYALTMAFNGAYSAADDPLTQAFVANKQAFRWLNHGFEHIYQGCVQDFTVVPWRCQTDANGAIVWRTQDEIANEISANIAVGSQLGLPFDPAEYLSGEHSGLRQLPQQADDNPNFVAALTAAGIGFIGSDASRETGARQVGSAITVPRHPTAVYYNTATAGQAVDEYNWLYTRRSDGGSGYCEDNPATATCIRPLNASGYLDYIIPTDAAYDLHFILSNDPRPFYAHASNLAGERILYPLLDSILGDYRSAFASSAPLLNLTLKQASRELASQAQWAASGMTTSPAVTGYVEQGQVVISNGTGSPVPITVPEGASVPGVTLESYGGERSAWLPASSTTVNLRTPPPLTISGTEFTVGQAGSISFTVDVSPAPTMSQTGALPSGLAFVADASGNGTIAGTPAAGTAGSYPITVTATTGSGRYDYPVTLTVRDLPRITSASSQTVREGTALNFTITSTGSPTASITSSGTLPAGVTFTALSGGTARLAGTPAAGTAGTYPLTLTATNTVGATSQAFTLTVGRPPVFTSATSAAALTGQAFSFVISSNGPPTPTITRTGTLPSGITFTARTDGTAILSGTPGPNSYGSYPLTFTATNAYGTVRQNFTLTVNKVPTIYSNNVTNFTAGTAGTFTVRSEAWPRATVSKTSGSLPTGVSFTTNTNGTATLAGTPATGTGGQYNLVLTATNTIGSGTQNFTLTVREAPKITSSSSVTFTRGQASSFTISASGWPLPSISRTGTLPPGVSFTAGSGTARLSGTPTTAGTWTLTISARNSLATVTQTLTIRVV